MKSFVTALVLTAVAGAAEAMPAAEFASHWNALTAQHREAIAASPELPVLIETFAEAGRAYRAEIDGAKATGRTPRACPPERITFSTDDFVAAYRELPAADQSGDVATVMGRILDARHPCPATV